MSFMINLISKVAFTLESYLWRINPNLGTFEIKLNIHKKQKHLISKGTNNVNTLVNPKFTIEQSVAFKARTQHAFTFDKVNFTALKAFKSLACRGDSAGPLMTTQKINGKEVYYVVGVVSYGPRLCGL
uniref:Uncharacterized protein n=1 Tax=Glossina austeni TaxID=7395 RepID=A0A1A9VAY0_GLOAU